MFPFLKKHPLFKGVRQGGFSKYKNIIQIFNYENISNDLNFKKYYSITILIYRRCVTI
jgi:hypothetical protein